MRYVIEITEKWKSEKCEKEEFNKKRTDYRELLV